MVTRRALLARLLSASLLAVSSGSTMRPPAGEQDEIEGRAPTPEELRPSVEAAFADESYRPGSIASLRIFNRARGIRMQLFRIGSDAEPTRGRSEMQGVAVTNASFVGSSRGHRIVRVPIGDWPSGLYFARLQAADGRVGFAPFVLRPRVLGENPVAVVMPTLTWQAYNLRDDDGDGQGDSWYSSWKIHTVRVARPFLNRGVPYNFRSYDLPFLEWLDRTGKQVDVLSQADLEATSSARALARAYRLIVFPGHHEYVTTREYDRIQGYRNLGGHLMFLSADNFCWRVVRHGRAIEKTRLWRDLGRPEAALIGVQYVNWNEQAFPNVPYTAAVDGWPFAGTGFRAGSRFGDYGIEIDETTADSPPGTEVLAQIPNDFGPGQSAQMTYYERGGAKVFAAGVMNFGGTALWPGVSKVLESVWERLSRP